jgi:hypothetical protein
MANIKALDKYSFYGQDVIMAKRKESGRVIIVF